MADFTKTVWVNKSDPAYNATTSPHITADQLNRMEAGIYDAVYKWTSGTLGARPAADASQKNHGYFATDDSPPSIYVCFDGANWTKVADLSGAGAGGATAFSERMLARISGNKAITAANTWNKVIFDTETFDHGNNYDPTTGYFTVDVAGDYEIEVNLYGNAAAAFLGECRVNDSTTDERMIGGALASAATPSSLSFGGIIPNLVATDKLCVYWQATAVISLRGDSVDARARNTFSVKRVG